MIDFLGFIGLILAAIIYFMPAIVAKKRVHPHREGIFLLNLFFGWTVIGWMIALIWAECHKE